MENTEHHETSTEVDERYPNTPIGIVRSRDAFLRDLPALMAIPKYDRWSVAYCGDERIGIAESHLDLIRECKRRGLRLDQYFIGCISPHDDEEDEIENGFYEFDDIEDLDAANSPNGTDPIP